MGSSFSLSDYYSIDLSVNNVELPEVHTPFQMTSYLQNLNVEGGRTLAYGGYLEKRGIYQSPLFQKRQVIRDIHLGVDVWCKEHTPIYAPVKGVVHSLAYNSNELDYGYTLIMKHQMQGIRFHTLYGHLGSTVNNLQKVGDEINAGMLIGHLGSVKENGGWSPHLHCQVIFNLEGNTGDYPGVCSEDDKVHYMQNCPDPTIFILPAN